MTLPGSSSQVKVHGHKMEKIHRKNIFDHAYMMHVTRRDRSS